MNTPTPPEVQNEILIAGQLAGLSSKLNDDVLERWLDTAPEDFNYEVWCRAAIAFKRALKLP